MNSPKNVRFSSFNASLNRNNDGDLVRDLSTPNNAQAKAVAEIIQRNQPDVLLLNEFDYVSSDPLSPVKLFQKNYLNISQNGAQPIDYPYVYIAPSNTGIPSGFDLNNNGTAVTTPGTAGYGDDAFGFGNFPGQFGMVLLSKYPIDSNNVRTFQNFLWKDMPGNLLTNDPTVDNPATPVNENLAGFYSPQEQAVLRLSSKSHWDIPLIIDGEIVHALVSHPTPPVFDGPEDRNGKRNHDEIRFWSDYITPTSSGYVYDDNGRRGGLGAQAKFVIMGDQNADPYDGDSYDRAILQLLQNPNINTNSIPVSEGGIQQAALQKGINLNHQGNPAFDTADFADTTPGNLRADYVLPSSTLQITDSRVYWGKNTDPQFPLVGTFDPNLPGGYPSSDHRMVWADINVGAQPVTQTADTPTFLGQTILQTGFIPEGNAGTIAGKSVPIGGLSGITYDATTNRYFAISDDRSENAPARFYSVNLDPITGNPSFTSVITLKDAQGKLYEKFSIDPEGIALTNRNTVFISSEGEVRPDLSRVTNPFINEYSVTTGELVRSLAIPRKFLPIIEDTNQNGTIDTTEKAIAGIRNNLAFESLTISPNQRFLYTANEAALLQDGDIPSLTAGSRNRIVQYNLTTGQAEKEYLYLTDVIPKNASTPTGFKDNGLVDLLAIDDQGTFIAMERSFAQGVGNTIRLYEISLQGATDISFYDSLNRLSSDQFRSIEPVQKRLLLNLDDLKLPTGLDNIEGIALGPRSATGEQSIVLVSDNNFSATQFTQIITLKTRLKPSELGQNQTFFGGSGDDIVTRFTGNQVIYANEGRNVITTGTGNDRIYGGSNVDIIVSGSGNDTIYANEGNNIINAGSGDDTVFAGSGNDTIELGTGNNLLYANGGDNIITSIGRDTIYTGSGRDIFKLEKGAGEATIIGFDSTDRIALGGGLKFVDLVLRQVGADTVLSAGTDTIATLKWTQSSSISAAVFI